MEKRITITGNAKNIDGHAVIESMNRDIYWLEGLAGWDENWIDRNVRATGDLNEERIPVQDTTTILYQHREKIIRCAIILLLEKGLDE